MEYHIEEIYKLAGRDDKVAVIEFIKGSESFNLYGPSITVAISYSQFEKERLEREFSAGSAGLTHGKVKARFLTGADLGESSVASLLNEGFNSQDVFVLYYGWDKKNLFYESKPREMRTMTIPMQIAPKGGDYDWMYGFAKRRVSKGKILNPHDREWYLAMKYYFEPEELSPEEKQEVLGENEEMKPGIEYKFVEIKIDREESSKEDIDCFSELGIFFAKRNHEILLGELAKVNSSVKKLAQINYPLLKHLFQGTYLYKPHDLNVMGRLPVYLDWEGYLHVFLRHVAEFETGGNTSGKSKFLWTPQEVIPVMKKVIESIDEEIQAFWLANPGKRFSRFGDKTAHFEGDYYTVQIEGDGRLSTFHPSEKRI